MSVSILHLSDLHRDPLHPLTNAALLDSLARDSERYIAEDPPIRAPDLIVVSGDLVTGVAPTATHAHEDLALQYSEAEAFLSDLTDHFLGGHRERVIIVPGNHDISYPHVQASLSPVIFAGGDPHVENIVAQYLSRLNSPSSRIRWSWKSLGFFEITDYERYCRRLEPFARFYRAFYQDTRPYALEADSQFGLFDYPEIGIIVAGFNSCHNNDPLNRVGSINPDCIAHVSNALRDDRFRGRLRVAVWHHSVGGPPASADYMDADTLQVLIDCRFSIGLHGHQHKTGFIDEHFMFGEGRKITVISAGTLCGGRDALPTGQPRSYNVLQIDTEKLVATLHPRRMQNEDLDSPIWGAGGIPSTQQTYYQFSVQSAILRGEDRINLILAEAEEHLSRGRPQEAIRLSRPYASTNGIARRLLLEGYVSIGDTASIAQFFYPPVSIAETIYVADALWERGDRDRLCQLVNLPRVRDSHDPAIVETRRKYEDRLRS